MNFLFRNACAFVIFVGIVNASCDFRTVAAECINDMSTLSEMVEQIIRLGPELETDPSKENDPEVQATFGAYCKSLATTAACVSEVATQNCSPGQQKAFEQKLKNIVKQARGASDLRMIHPYCIEMLGTLKFLG